MKSESNDNLHMLSQNQPGACRTQLSPAVRRYLINVPPVKYLFFHRSGVSWYFMFLDIPITRGGVTGVVREALIELEHQHTLLVFLV